eukprot:jgi/Tetstr1/447034/TSEL_034491.t1
MAARITVLVAAAGRRMAPPFRPPPARRRGFRARTARPVSPQKRTSCADIRASPWPGAASPDTLSTADANKLLQGLAGGSGIWGRLHLTDGRHGRGMATKQEAFGPEPPVAESPMDGALYLSVPAALTLSADLPGTAAEVRSEPCLVSLLASSLPWEIKLGGILAVACRPTPARPPGSAFAFWQQYRPLMPPAEAQTSLLFFAPEDMEALQDEGMATVGRRWQRQVGEAHAEHFAAAAVGDVPAISLPELRWGVGTVESRAFSVKLDGREHAVAVPFLDMVNHEPHALCFHHFDASTARFELRSLGPPLSPGAEAIISYGNKANARLLEQYGFVIPGNTFDRVGFPDPAELGGPRISRDKLVAALGLDSDYGPRSPEMQRLHDLVAREAANMAAGQGLPPAADAEAGWRSLWGHEEERRISAVAASLLERACWRSLPELAAVQGGLPETHTLGALADWAARALAAYPTTIDADEEALRARGGQPGGRAAVAVQSRLERKRLLATAARTLTLLETAYAAAASTSA